MGADVGGHQDPLSMSSFFPSGYQGGLRMSAQDSARLGLLLLAGGVWGAEGHQVIPRSWVQRASSACIKPNTPVNCTNPCSRSSYFNEPAVSEALPFCLDGHPGQMGGDLGYGLSLWLMPQDGAVHMSGKHANYVIIDGMTGLIISVRSRRDCDYYDEEQHPNAAQYLEHFRAAIISEPVMSV